MPKYRPEPERFWEKVDRGAPDECWLWRGRITTTGYGQFNLTGRRPAYAHRWVMGDIPPGMVVDHRCHNRACVNPNHLRLGTQAQNVENHSGPTKASKSGIRGVYFETGTQSWVAQVKSQRHGLYFERFPTKEAAAIAVLEARNRMFTFNDLDRSHD